MKHHELGPWEVVQYTDITIVNSINGLLVALADDSEEALLMAAAPEAISACLAVLEQMGDEACWYDHHGYCQTHNLAEGKDCWAYQVRAAILKALGSDVEPSQLPLPQELEPAL